MLPDRVSNPGPRTYESGALPIALRGPALIRKMKSLEQSVYNSPYSKASAVISARLFKASLA